MATAVQEARAQSPNTGMFDTGDSLVSADAKRRGSLNEQNVRKAELMADYLQVARPEAVALGELDLIAGPSAATSLLTSRGIVPVATNVRFKDPAVKTVPSAAWETAGYRFLAVNLFAPRAAAGLEGVEISDPLAALDAVLQQAGLVDVLLVSCHRFDDALMKRLAEKDGPPRIAIDVDGSTHVKSASSVTRTVFAKPPPRGTDLVTAELYLKRDAPYWYRMDRHAEAVRRGKGVEEEEAAAQECSLVDFRTRRLFGNVKGHPGVLAKIEEYKAWTRNAVLTAAPDDASAPKYTGAEACGSCHEEQLANWKATYHADAWESLVKDPDGGAADPECVSCHVSGFLQPGGPRKIEETGPFRGVQCESCHLPMEKHPGGAKHPKVNEALCRTCHSETRDPNFDFAKYLKYATCTKPHDRATNRVPR